MERRDLRFCGFGWLLRWVGAKGLEGLGFEGGWGGLKRGGTRWFTWMALLMSQQRGELEREGGGIDRPLQKHKSDFQIQASTTYLPKPTPSRQNTSESFFYHGCWGIWPHKSTFTLLRPKSNTFSATKPGFCRWTATPILRVPHNFEDTDDHSTFTCIIISPV